MRTPLIAAASLALALSGQPALAQGTVTDVLEFLLTNRSIPTDDFARDARAAAETRDTISTLLAAELGRLPMTAGAGGFTYRMNPALGVMERSSASFGPIYVERALTTGSNQALVSLLYYTESFDNIDGRPLRNGTLVATASRVHGETQPFDIETLSLRLRTSTVALLGTYGVTNRLDVGLAVPFVRLTMSGRREDTYRGQQNVQASGSASASGLGDVVVRGKYAVLQGQTIGLAAGAEMRLPTGRRNDLLGGGETTLQPRVILSMERARVGVHGVIGPVFGVATGELDYALGVTHASSSRLTLVTEIIGRRVDAVGTLTEATEPHPTLEGIDTIRLSSVPRSTDRLIAVVGVKWNVAGSWLLNGHAQRSLTTAGLNAGWAPSVSLDYSFGE